MNSLSNNKRKRTQNTLDQACHVFFPAEDQVARLSEDGAYPYSTSNPPAGSVDVIESTVVMPPIVVSVLGVLFSPEVTQIRGLMGAVGHRSREYQDCAMIAIRAWLARHIIGLTWMILGQIVFGVKPDPSSPAFYQTLLLLPSAAPRVGTITDKLTPAKFSELITAYQSDCPGTSRYMYAGTGNCKSDAVCFFQNMDGTAFPVYVSTKQRCGKRKVSVKAASIQAEMEKDLMEPAHERPYVHVYSTDQIVRSQPNIPSLMVVGPDNQKGILWIRL